MRFGFRINNIVKVVFLVVTDISIVIFCLVFACVEVFKVHFFFRFEESDTECTIKHLWEKHLYSARTGDLR